ncbi:MAG: hypothetical protein LW865_02090 [Betaproteobacteria bacterium]|jgi:hypothetical protein|nr:hypothetical protein [Betaproteobacteria bacterium]
MISTKWGEYAQAMIRQMVDVVNQNGFLLLQRYPDDLMVHDRAYLTRFARPGMVFAWCVGDSHSHLTIVGLTKSDTELVSALTGLGSKDRFFRIRCSADGAMFDALSREEFARLATTPVPYQVKNTTDGIALWRDEELVGTALIRRLTPEPQCTNATYEAIIRPAAAVSEVELAALETATCLRIRELGSLFAFYNITVVKPMATTASTTEAACYA